MGYRLEECLEGLMVTYIEGAWIETLISCFMKNRGWICLNKILFETDYRLQPRANEIAPSVGGAMLSGRFAVIYRGMAK